MYNYWSQRFWTWEGLGVSENEVPRQFRSTSSLHITPHDDQTSSNVQRQDTGNGSVNTTAGVAFNQNITDKTPPWVHKYTIRPQTQIESTVNNKNTGDETTMDREGNNIDGWSSLPRMGYRSVPFDWRNPRKHALPTEKDQGNVETNVSSMYQPNSEDYRNANLAERPGDNMAYWQPEVQGHHVVQTAPVTPVRGLSPERIAKREINPNSKASNAGVRVGDFVERLNGQATSGLQHADALSLIRQANQRLVLELRRGSLPDIKLGSVNGYADQQATKQTAKHAANHVSTQPFIQPNKQHYPPATKPYIQPISYTSDTEDYRPVSKPATTNRQPYINAHRVFSDVSKTSALTCDVTPDVSTSTGLTYSDVCVASPCDDESASTSSQSSVIHVNDSRRASIASNHSNSNFLQGNSRQLQRNTNQLQSSPKQLQGHHNQLPGNQNQLERQANQLQSHTKQLQAQTNKLQTLNTQLHASGDYYYQENSASASLQSPKQVSNQPIGLSSHSTSQSAQQTATHQTQQQAKQQSQQQPSLHNQSGSGNVTMKRSPCASPTPQTTVWSPSGKTSVKTYKPIQFSASSTSSKTKFSAPNSPQPFTSGTLSPTGNPSTPSRAPFARNASLDSSSTTHAQLNAQQPQQQPFASSFSYARPSSSLGVTSPHTDELPQSFGYTSASVQSSASGQPSWNSSQSSSAYSSQFNANSSISSSSTYAPQANSSGSLDQQSAHAPSSYQQSAHAPLSSGSGVTSPTGSDVTSGQTISSEARWTPSLSSSTTLHMNTEKGAPSNQRSGQAGKATPPPVKQKPSLSGSPASHPHSSPLGLRNGPSPTPPATGDKGISLFYGQRDKHTEDDDANHSANENIALSPSPRPFSPQGVSQHGASPSGPSPVRSNSTSNALPSALVGGLGNLRKTSKPVKVVRIQDDLDRERQSRGLPSSLTQSQRADMSEMNDISATVYHNGTPQWDHTAQADTKDGETWRIPVTIETKSVKTPQYGSSPTSLSWPTSQSSSHPSSQTHSQLTSQSATQWNGSMTGSESHSGMPQTQSSTITLLQKGRESAVPAGAVLVGQKEVVEGDTVHTDTYYMLPTSQGSTTTTRMVQQAGSKYQGIGPVDNDTGMPVGFRSGVDDKNQKDWYRKMYKSLHKTETDNKEDEIPDESTVKEANTYKPSYVFPEDRVDGKKEEPNPYRPSYESPNRQMSGGEETGGGLDRNSDRYRSLPMRSKTSWTPAHASYRENKYKNQPRSIADYEPGKSSIALKETRLQQMFNPPIEKPGQFSRYYESDTELDIRKVERPVSPAHSEKPAHDVYRAVQKGGDIPQTGFRFPVPAKKERSLSTSSVPMPVTINTQVSGSNPPSAALSPRQRRDEENARRRQQLEKATEEQRQRKYEETMRENAARRHQDVHIQKSPIPLDRYGTTDVDSGATELQRPTRKVQTLVRGKCRARYTFTAQNPRELSFRKGDTVYLLKQVDRNWGEGERHGVKGLFPLNYVEILTSLAEAEASAREREGQARAKYSFTAQTGMELSLNKGDIVHVIRRVDDNWLEGRLGGRQGIFPASYVEICQEPHTPLATPLPSLAPTPIPGSPGQLSPCSSIAPTIPTAPHSPSSQCLDTFDFDTPMYDFNPSGFGHPSGSSRHRSLSSNTPSGYNSYHGASTRSLSTSGLSNPRSGSSYGGSLDRGVNMAPEIGNLSATAPRRPASSSGYRQQSGSGSRSTPGTPYMDVPRSAGYQSSPGGGNMNDHRLQDQLDYVLGQKSATLDRHSYSRDSQPVERPQTTPPYLNGGMLGERDWGHGRDGRKSPYAGLTMEDFYPSDLRSTARSLGYETTAQSSTQSSTQQQQKAPIQGQSLSQTSSQPQQTARQPSTQPTIQPTTQAPTQSQPKQTAKDSFPLYRALYQYRPQNADELELREGDIVSVMERCDDGWFVGTCQATGHFGTFPGNYVTPM